MVIDQEVLLPARTDCGRPMQKLRIQLHRDERCPNPLNLTISLFIPFFYQHAVIDDKSAVKLKWALQIMKIVLYIPYVILGAGILLLLISLSLAFVMCSCKKNKVLLYYYQNYLLLCLLEIYVLHCISCLKNTANVTFSFDPLGIYTCNFKSAEYKITLTEIQPRELLQLNRSSV